MKYWEKGALTKIVGLVGNPVKANSATTMKQRLMYARVMVEVKMNHPLPNTVLFENEVECVVEKKEEYEWKPIFCMHCQIFGHEFQNCRKAVQVAEEKNGKQQVTVEQTNNLQAKLTREGEKFIKTNTRKAKMSLFPKENVITTNNVFATYA